MEQSKLLVLGSVNADHVIHVPSLPRPGETISGHHYQIIPGGKGANQAVACTRLGGDTRFMACMGSDAFGLELLTQYNKMGMKTDTVECVPGKATGVALICVDSNAENSIAIAPEANACLTAGKVNAHAEAIEKADWMLMQLETPLEGLQQAINQAIKHKTRVMLNPAPARRLPAELLAGVDIITPNQTEAEVLTGVTVNDTASAATASARLHEMGIGTVIITMGAKGAWVSETGNGYMVEGFVVKPVDTTAAGDTFNGALLVAFAENQSLKDAVRFANAAGALSVTRRGAQPSVPTRNEVHNWLQNQ